VISSTKVIRCKIGSGGEENKEKGLRVSMFSMLFSFFLL
jgi:hypothetical protein